MDEYANFPRPKIEPRHVKEALERFARQRKENNLTEEQLQDKELIIKIFEAASNNKLWEAREYQFGFFISRGVGLDNMEWLREATVRALMNKGYLKVYNPPMKSSFITDNLITLTELGWKYYEELRPDFDYP